MDIKSYLMGRSAAAPVDPAVIEQAVSDWLDEHPEATTTVQDGSITKAKLDSNLQGTVDEVSVLKSAISVSQPDEPLEWIENGYIKVNTGAFAPSNSYALSNYVKVAEGQTVYCYGQNAGNQYLVCAYDNSFNFVPASSVGDISSTTKNVTYTVPSGVAYIRLGVGANFKPVSEIITTQYYHYDPKDMAEFWATGDLSFLRFVTGFYYDGTQKRLLPAGDQKTVQQYGFLDASKIYAIYFDNTTDYSNTITFYDNAFAQLSTASRNQMFDFGFPANTRYVRVNSTKSAGTANISEVGLHIISKECLAHESIIRGFEMQRPQNWDKNTLFNSLCVSEPDEEKMAHTSNIYDGEDGYFYIPYYENPVNQIEGIGQPIISKISRVSQCNPRSITVVPIAERGQDFGNFVQSSTNAPYDAFLMPKSSDVYSLAFVATPTSTDKATMAVREFTKSTMTASATATISQFKYTLDGETYTVPMDTDNLDTFVNRLLGDTENTHTIGIYPILTRAYKYGNDYYTYLGGLQNQNAKTGFGGCLIKTSDYGATWEFVAYNPALTDYVTCMWEGAINIDSTGRVFCLLRAYFVDAEIGTSIYACDMAMYYDIASGTWSTPIRLNGLKGDTLWDKYINEYGNYSPISTDNSRPFVYIKNGYTYLMCNVAPRLSTVWKTGGVVRSTLRIYKCDNTLNVIDRKSIQSDAGVSYFSCINARGREWFCFTEDRKHLQNDCKGDIAIIPMKEDFLP